MFTLMCLGRSFPGHGPFREMKARDTVFRKAYTHVREFITNPTLWTPMSPQQSISLKPNPWDHFRQRRCRDLGERPPTLGCWGQAPATAWGSEQNSCRLRGSEAIVCLRRFSTEAPAARRKRPWGARGTRRGHGGVCGTGHPGQKALSPSRLGAGSWPSLARVPTGLAGRMDTSVHGSSQLARPWIQSKGGCLGGAEESRGETRG